ncbi:MAG: hypothetical protein F6K47_05950 [Symploca sp. SIO2E6]|nr:hypothetical protein [Symploca sp. SIO2E6]
MASSPVELISSLASSIQNIKGTYELIAPLKNLLILPGQRKNISELQGQIQDTESKVQELKLSIAGLSKLVRSYADLIGDVRVATASSDKFSELIELQPDLLLNLKTFFANNIRDEYTRVTSGIANLPKPQNTESGQKFGNLEIIARNLRDLIQQLRDSNSGDKEQIKAIAKKLSSQYSDMEATLSELLREILAGLEST